MKKIAAILLAMVMLFTAGACSKPDDNDGKNGTQNGEQGSTENGQQGGTENGEEDGTLNGGVDPEDLLYKDIPRYMSVSPLTQKISFTGDDTVLNIAGPDGWVLRNAEDGSFHITREGRIVGNIRSTSDKDFVNWKTVASKSYEKDGVRAQRDIQRKGSGESLAFRYHFRYEFFEGDTCRQITLTAECAEISDSVAQAMLRAELSSAKEERWGQLFVMGEEPDRILILGNSFIGSSQIGNILREMMTLSGKNCEVVAIARGYATASQYAADTAILDEIERGVYDAVFLCGFYGSGNAQAVATINEECKKSDTDLVIFPAHNEAESVFSAAKESNPSVLLMNWKGEIDAIIAYRGLSKWDFCVDDAHDHSTPPAGYV